MLQCQVFDGIQVIPRVHCAAIAIRPCHLIAASGLGIGFTGGCYGIPYHAGLSGVVRISRRLAVVAGLLTLVRSGLVPMCTREPNLLTAGGAQ